MASLHLSGGVFFMSEQNKKIIKSLHRKDLTNIKFASALLDMAIEEKNDDLDFALQQAKEVQKIAAKESRKKNSIEFASLYWKATLMLAPYDFDSYLLYLEKDRDAPERFYLPRRKQFLKLGIVQTLQDLEDDKLDIVSLSMPPGTSKTTVGEFFMSWAIGRHPEDYNLFSSHSGDITRMFYDAVLAITTSEVYRWKDIFPDVFIESQNAKMETLNFGKFKPFKTLQCRSIDSKNAGVVRCNRYLYCDDLIGGIEEALSKPRLDKLWTKYSVDLRQRKKEGCKEIHVATRWSVHDVIGRLKLLYDNSERAKFIAYPDIDPKTGESNFEYDYGVGFTKAFFEDIEKSMDDVSYKCLYKNEPIEREGLLYHEDELRRYLTLPVGEPDAIIGICDTKNKGTDFLFLPVAYMFGTDCYIENCICDDNSDYGVQYERCSNIIVEHKMQKCEFESNNGGDRIALEVSKKVEKKGGRCSISTKYTSANKETKIIVNADWVKKHCLFKSKELYEIKDDYGKMMAFLLSYSVAGKNSHDDVPDGLAQLALFIDAGIGAAASYIDSPI